MPKKAPQKAPSKAAKPRPTAAKPAAKPAAAGANPAAMGQDFSALWSSFGGLHVSVESLKLVQQQYVEQASKLWMEGQAGDLTDRRFAAQAWTANPAAKHMAQMYLLNARAMMGLADAVQGDEKTRTRLRFAVQQWIDAASPANYFALNPEVQQRALESKGQSVLDGMQNLLADMQRGQLSHTDPQGFEVGRNVATTQGSVVFENEWMQLIEYTPLTPQVHERPMLFVPPCINKFYILDLQPDNSLIRHTVAQGHRTFVISWRNPDASLATATWDDYIEHGPLAAMRVVRQITGAKTINTLGFCVGGTILATALAVLAARGEHPAHSLTLLTTLLDFADTGVLDVFIDEPMVQWREATLGPDAPGGPGLLQGKELASTFNFLRPNDLVWNYVVGNYLKGEAPPLFDLLYWNGDATNLPGPMYVWYLRHMYLQNELKVPGALTVCGERVDLGQIKAPVFVYASREDHIVPWTAAYRSVSLMRSPVTFVLGASGHIAGVINPPDKGKRSHWLAPSQASKPLVTDAEQWLAQATEVPGSWWPAWTSWLAKHAGAMKAAPRRAGSPAHPVLEPAPGRYVKVKA
jgi:polyhydroxyalkanoate synthase subunit PhaC